MIPVVIKILLKKKKTQDDNIVPKAVGPIICLHNQRGQIVSMKRERRSPSPDINTGNSQICQSQINWAIASL